MIGYSNIKLLMSFRRTKGVECGREEKSSIGSRLHVEDFSSYLIRNDITLL